MTYPLIDTVPGVLTDNTVSLRLDNRLDLVSDIPEATYELLPTDTRSATHTYTARPACTSRWPHPTTVSSS